MDIVFQVLDNKVAGDESVVRDCTAKALCLQFGVSDVNALGNGSVEEMIALQPEWSQSHSIGVYNISVIMCQSQFGVKQLLDPNYSFSMCPIPKTLSLSESAKEKGIIAIRNVPCMYDIAQATYWSLTLSQDCGSLESFLASVPLPRDLLLLRIG